MHRKPSVSTLAAALFAALGTVPLAAGAATITVTSNADNGAGTLRNAIATAATGDTINFDTTAFPVGGTNTITLTSFQLSTSLANLTIDATANGDVTIDANHASGVMYDNAAAGGSLTLNHLTLRNGKLNGNNTVGGGIDIPLANLTLAYSTISGSSSGYGGGIYSYSGNITLVNSTLSGNSSFSGGGIAFYSGSLTLTNSTLSGNSSSSFGGGIFSHGGSSITLTNSTLSGNSSGNYGGGIYSRFGSITLINSTLSGNSSNYGGAGITSRTGNVTLASSTLSGNSSNTRSGGIDNFSGSITANNSIVAGNTQHSGGDVNPGVSSGANNLIGVIPNLNLGTLANNGGPTQTMMPQPGSPAINAIACTGGPATDQRGYMRPDPGSTSATPCDIGAVEANSISDEIFKDGFGPAPSHQ